VLDQLAQANISPNPFKKTECVPMWRIPQLFEWLSTLLVLTKLETEQEPKLETNRMETLKLLTAKLNWKH
jgi:hypothetical protein